MTPIRRHVAAALVVLATTGCSVSVGSDSETESPRPMSNSQLDRAGVDQILESGRARFDLKDLELTPEEVGVRPDRMGPLVGRPGGTPIELTLVGPEGEDTVTTSTFSATFSTTGTPARTITWFESYDTEADAFDALDAAVEQWGLRREAITNWRETLALGGEQEVSLPLGVSPSGFVNQVTVRGEEGSGQTHQWAVLLRPEYYRPAALEEIRRTGNAPKPG
ncbi:hypothetical protein [Nocardioides marmoraquaticus]